MASATAQDFMKSLSSKGKGTPSKNILYGVEGVGKTSLLANAAKPFCIMCAGETGLLTLLDNSLIPDVPHFDPFTDWTVLMGTLQAIAEGGVKNIKTLFIDSAGTTQNLLVDHLIKTQCKGDSSRYSDYGHGVKISTPVWREFLALLDRINQTGIQVWLIGHSLVTTFKNPEGSDYNRYSLALQDAICEMTKQWSDNIFFMNYFTAVENKKGIGENDRYLYCQRTPAFDAKNRCNLTSSEGYKLPDNGAEAWGELVRIITDAKKKKA